LAKLSHLKRISLWLDEVFNGIHRKQFLDFFHSSYFTIQLCEMKVAVEIAATQISVVVPHSLTPLIGLSVIGWRY